MKELLAIDIGGTKVEVCAFSEDFDLKLCERHETKIFSVGTKTFLDEIKEVIKEKLGRNVSKMGVSFNCVIKNGVIVFSSLLGGRVDLAVEEMFQKEFGLPVKVLNDVNAMGLAESHFGKGINAESFVLLNLGTGIRPAFVQSGKIIEGFGGNFGEISQREVFVPELGGVKVKYDNLLAGRGLSHIYEIVSGERKSAREVFELFTAGKQEALDAVAVFNKQLALFLQELSYFYNPELIILNGSLKKSSDLFLPQVFSIFRKETTEIFHFKDILVSEVEHGACLGTLI